MITKITYRCEHCWVEGAEEEYMRLHEDECLYNPKNRTCFTCQHTHGEFCECKESYSDEEKEYGNKFVGDSYPKNCEWWNK